MIRPPRPSAIIRRAAACAHRNWAVRSTSITRRKVSRSSSRKASLCVVAAQLTSTPRAPSSSASSSITVSAPGSASRSKGRATARTPSSSHSSTVSRRARLVLVPRDPDVAPAARERDGGGAADSRVAAGDDRGCHVPRACPPVCGSTWLLHPLRPRRSIAAMSETTTGFYQEGARARAISTTQLLGQVLFLVAIALGFCAFGTLLGRDLSLGTARICSFAGFGMLLVSSFAGARFRVGAFAMGWLFAHRADDRPRPRAGAELLRLVGPDGRHAGLRRHRRHRARVCLASGSCSRRTSRRGCARSR